MRIVSPRDQHFFDLVQQYRALPSGRKRDHVFARMHHLQHRNLEHYAYKFRSPKIPMLQEDAMQAALVGFLRAIEKWDPQRGAWIGTLFIWCRKEVQVAQGLEPIVYRPTTCAKPYKVYRAEEAFYAAHGRDATDEDLGTKAGDLDKWSLQERFCREDLDSPMRDSGREQGPTTGARSALALSPSQSRYMPEPQRNALELLEAAELDAQLDALTPYEIEILLDSDCDEKEELRARFA